MRESALDHHQVVGLVGKGAGSQIYRIRDLQTGQDYAMKVTIRRTSDDWKYLLQAQHEYEVARRLDHPNLVKFFDLRLKRRWFRLREVRTLMEYVEGITLDRLGPVPLPCSVHLLLEVARALEHMHDREVFHADLKATNVMVTRRGAIKVLDFGLAWLKGQEKRRIQGTQGYLAPEQLRHRVVTAKTDLYNFGVLAYRLLGGQLQRRSSGEGHAVGWCGLLLRPLRELNPTVPEELAQLVEQCCAENPSQRPGSCPEVRQRLETIRLHGGWDHNELETLVKDRWTKGTKYSVASP
jgi:serine/threonine protein kinase